MLLTKKTSPTDEQEIPAFVNSLQRHGVSLQEYITAYKHQERRKVILFFLRVYFRRYKNGEIFILTVNDVSQTFQRAKHLVLYTLNVPNQSMKFPGLALHYLKYISTFRKFP